MTKLIPGDLFEIERRPIGPSTWSAPLHLAGQTAEVVEVYKTEVGVLVNGDPLTVSLLAVGRVFHGTGKAASE